MAASFISAFRFFVERGLFGCNFIRLQPSESRKSTDCAGQELSIQYNYRFSAIPGDRIQPA